MHGGTIYTAMSTIVIVMQSKRHAAATGQFGSSREPCAMDDMELCSILNSTCNRQPLQWEANRRHVHLQKYIYIVYIYAHYFIIIIYCDVAVY
jgi:hypothetical protein